MSTPATSWLTTMASLTRRQRPRRPVRPRRGDDLFGRPEFAAVVHRGDRTLIGLGLENRCPLWVLAASSRLCENSDVELARRKFVSITLNNKRTALAVAVERRKE